MFKKSLLVLTLLFPALALAEVDVKKLSEAVDTEKAAEAVDMDKVKEAVGIEAPAVEKAEGKGSEG